MINVILIALTWALFVNIGLPAVAAICLTVLFAFGLIFELLLVMYFFNLDSKMLAVLQKIINKHYDKRDRNRHLE